MIVVPLSMMNSLVIESCQVWGLKAKVWVVGEGID